jgi:peptide deformylase
MDTIDNELFHVTEHAIIYNPVYKITFRNMKNNEETTVSIDGVTAEVTK